MSNAAAKITPPLLMRRLSEELSTLASLSDDLAGLAHDCADDHSMVRAQGQDLLQQTLTELSRFLSDVAHSMDDLPERDVSMALAAVRLSDLAARLQGRPPESDPAGDLDLF